MATKTKRRAAPKTPATRTVYVGGRPAGARPGTREVTPREVAAAPGRAAATITQRDTRYSAKHMLTAELIVAVLIVGIRAVADYEPQADGTLKGKIGHPKGQYGPLPILTGLIVVFFLLSFAAASGGLKAKLAVIAGAVIDLGLLFNSHDEFTKVAGTFGKLGKARVPPGNWQTEASGMPAAGTPISGTLGGGGPGSPPPGGGSGGGSGGGVPSQAPPGSIPVPASGTCPSNYMLQGTGPGGPQWCAPLNS